MKTKTKILSSLPISAITLSLTITPMAQAYTQKENANTNANSNQQTLKANYIPKDAQKEGDHYVKYISDEELKNEMARQGYDTSGFDTNDNDFGFYAAKKGGVTKAVYKKNGYVDLYLSHSAATQIVKAGGSGAAGALGGLIGGGTGGFIGSFAGYIISSYGGKAVPKNGIIIKGKVDGSVQSVIAQ